MEEPPEVSVSRQAAASDPDVKGTPVTEQSETSDSGNAAQIAYWNDQAASTWTAFQERIDAVFEPLTALAMEAAAPALGERVIDVGCGCGATVLELARRVGPDGRVLGLDVSAPMSARARERVAEAGLGNATVLVADASVHAFAASGTDLVFSRFGVMFFAEPAAAFANLRLATRSGGRLLFAAWRPMADNAWFAVPMEAGRRHLPPQPPPEPDAPGPFAFADADRVRRILVEAGWRNVSLDRHDVPMRLAAAGDLDGATEFVTRVGPLSRLLAEADPDLRAIVRREVAEAVRTADGPDGVVLGGSVWLASAQA